MPRSPTAAAGRARFPARSLLNAADARIAARASHGGRELDVVRETRADPDAPNVTVLGRRRRDGLREMWLAGQVSAAHWDAVVRFRDDVEAIDGANRQRGGWEGSPAAFGSGSVSDYRIDAASRVRGAWRAVGQVSAGVVGWVVLGPGSLDGYCVAKGLGKPRVRTWLMDGLDRLADFYAEV